MVSDVTGGEFVEVVQLFLPGNTFTHNTEHRDRVEQILFCHL